ncbi:MAG: hypothetical protein CM15mP117_24370 [Alphaproteobacteria bacterium]|nr:MAG: hypothetical protein CM15mP117_24370 [Alphaproteobacteria bacterium]
MMLPWPLVILLPESRPITILSLPVALLNVELPIAIFPDPALDEESVLSPIAIFS